MAILLSGGFSAAESSTTSILLVCHPSKSAHAALPEFQELQINFDQDRPAVIEVAVAYQKEKTQSYFLDSHSFSQGQMSVPPPYQKAGTFHFELLKQEGRWTLIESSISTTKFQLLDCEETP